MSMLRMTAAVHGDALARAGIASARTVYDRRHGDRTSVSDGAITEVDEYEQMVRESQIHEVISRTALKRAEIASSLRPSIVRIDSG